MNKGTGERIIGGGVQNRSWGGFYGTFSDSLSFHPPLFYSFSLREKSPKNRRN